VTAIGPISHRLHLHTWTVKASTHVGDPAAIQIFDPFLAQSAQRSGSL